MWKGEGDVWWGRVMCGRVRVLYRREGDVWREGDMWRGMCGGEG